MLTCFKVDPQCEEARRNASDTQTETQTSKMGKTKAIIPTTQETLRTLQRSSRDSKKEIAALKTQLKKKGESKQVEDLNKKVQLLFRHSKDAFKKLHHRYVLLNTQNVELKAKCNKLEMKLRDNHLRVDNQEFLAEIKDDPVLSIIPSEYDFLQEQLPDDYKDGGEIRLQ